MFCLYFTSHFHENYFKERYFLWKIIVDKKKGGRSAGTPWPRCSWKWVRHKNLSNPQIFSKKSKYLPIQTSLQCGAYWGTGRQRCVTAKETQWKPGRGGGWRSWGETWDCKGQLGKWTLIHFKNKKRSISIQLSDEFRRDRLFPLVCREKCRRVHSNKVPFLSTCPRCPCCH